MGDSEIKELEEFLLPFALKRFDFSSYKTNMPLAKMAQSMAKSMVGTYLTEYATWLVRAYARVLYNVPGEIYLKDLAAVTLAEASYMAGIGPFGPFNMRFGTTSSGKGRDSMEVTAEAEIHAWMLYLQENDKLPGIYERFTGRYYLK